MHLILLGILVKTLNPGLNQRHSVKHTKGQENIVVFILGIQILKVLKLLLMNVLKAELQTTMGQLGCNTLKELRKFLFTNTE